MPKTTDPVLIAPSLIADDLSVMGITARSFDPAIVDLLHMDVMDGNFVPNLTFGPGYIQNLQKHVAVPLDVHLMIEKPEHSVEQYMALKPWCVTIHYESTRFPGRILSQIRNAKIIAGLALNPATPVENSFDLLPFCDIVLIMSVDPGFYGQTFMESSLERIERLAGHLKKAGYGGKIRIQVDGGITRDNISKVVKAGASIVVAGSASFRGGDVNRSVRELKESAGAT